MGIPTKTALAEERWMDWATDRWLELPPDSDEARQMLKAIFKEQRRRMLHGEPRRLVQRDILKRLDPRLIRERIWKRARRALRDMKAGHA